MNPTCRLTMLKRRHRLEFEYVDGRELDLLASGMPSARRRANGFDWLDAAALSLRTGRRRHADIDSVVRTALGQRL